jgi:hypothetical protein
MSEQAVWLAKSTDRKTWTNVQDERVLSPGGRLYKDFDVHGVTMKQVFKRGESYYALYDCHEGRDLGKGGRFNTCLARSGNLVAWEKYPGNPIVTNQTSGIVVDPDGDGPIPPRLYTMHPEVRVFEPALGKAR